MDSIIDLYPDADILPAADANAYRDAAYGYARTQGALADFYNGESGGALMLFDITAKTHWMLHGADNALYLNPRLSWNSAGEDFMGKVKVPHASCCRGNNAACQQISLQVNTVLHCISFSRSLLVACSSSRKRQLHAACIILWTTLGLCMHVV